MRSKLTEYIAATVLIVSTLVLLTIFVPVIHRIIIRLLFGLWTFADLLPYGGTPKHKYLFMRLFWYSAAPGAAVAALLTFQQFRSNPFKVLIVQMSLSLSILLLTLSVAFIVYETASVARVPQDVAALFYGPASAILSSILAVVSLKARAEKRLMRSIVTALLAPLLTLVLVLVFPEVRLEWHI